MTAARPTASGPVIAGIDEVGRGPLAGPVVAAAVILQRPCAGIADSKVLSALSRQQVARELSECALIGIGAASVAEIERLNILQAGLLAMRRALLRLGVVPDLALIDGRQAPALPCPVETVVGGDALIAEIGAASVVAKVARDRLMQRLARRYPGYGWETNVGYGTAAHLDGLRRLGPSRHHRRTFKPVAAHFAPPLLDAGAAVITADR